MGRCLLPRSAASLSATLQAKNVQKPWTPRFPLLEMRAHLARHRDNMCIELQLSWNRPWEPGFAAWLRRSGGLKSWMSRRGVQFGETMSIASCTAKNSWNSKHVIKCSKDSKGPRCLHVFSRQQTQAEPDEAVRTVSAFVPIRTYYDPNVSYGPITCSIRRTQTCTVL